MKDHYLVEAGAVALWAGKMTYEADAVMHPVIELAEKFVAIRVQILVYLRTILNKVDLWGTDIYSTQHKCLRLTMIRVGVICIQSKHMDIWITLSLCKDETLPTPSCGWVSISHTNRSHVRPGAVENSSIVYPVENMSIDGVHYSCHWNPAPRSNGFPSPSHNIEVPVPHYQTDASGPLRDPFLYPPASGSFSVAPENYAHHGSSSNYGGQPFHGTEGGFIDVGLGNARGPYKRKSPGVPAVCERGSSSRYYEAGSSSDIPIPSDIWQEKPNTDSHRISWDCPAIGSAYRGNNLTIGSEGTLRNVRSRAALDLETNLSRTHLSITPSQHPYTTGNPVEHSGPVELMGQSSNAPAQEWNHIHVSPAAHGRILLPESYSSRHPRRLSTVGWRNSERSGRARGSSDRYQSLSEEASFRDRLSSELYTIGGLRTVLMSARSPFLAFIVCNGLMIVDRSALYSRSLLDQHRDMRLDIDNMSYEELLALGERIGHVSTGLSEDMILKCLTESIYCSSDQFQEEGTCVICLEKTDKCYQRQPNYSELCSVRQEEYKDMDDVGTLKTCRHDFHVGCIRTWLSMKNLCPICKSCALADHMKQQ
ncbi:unnamed protein product [Thlaspi arvense]|uniref:RING-type E3 ubiquitin transferase n=1 Tax=Thlaspi arvense TaxID=13288 RepID=A0AAU9RSY4_THLAR|nr:unnamed protein product [Thlaspi arvense]